MVLMGGEQTETHILLCLSPTQMYLKPFKDHIRLALWQPIQQSASCLFLFYQSKSDLALQGHLWEELDLAGQKHL